MYTLNKNEDFPSPLQMKLIKHIALLCMLSQLPGAVDLNDQNPVPWKHSQTDHPSVEIFSQTGDNYPKWQRMRSLNKRAKQMTDFEKHAKNAIDATANAFQAAEKAKKTSDLEEKIDLVDVADDAADEAGKQAKKTAKDSSALESDVLIKKTLQYTEDAINAKKEAQKAITWAMEDIIYEATEKAKQAKRAARKAGRAADEAAEAREDGDSMEAGNKANEARREAGKARRAADAAHELTEKADSIAIPNDEDSRKQMERCKEQSKIAEKSAQEAEA